jgi:dCMP deaminase
MSLNWDELFFNVIKEYKTKSKDPSSQFAAIIIDDDNNPVSFGFNGFPRKVNDSPERYADRELKYKMVVHAEANAICAAASKGDSTKGCRIYIDSWPCSSCCGMIIQAKIKEVILNGDSEIHNNAIFQERWKESIDVTKMMLEEAGVNVRIYKRS